MTRWLLGRLVQAAVTLFVAVTLLFFVMRLVGGDPVPPDADRQLSGEAVAHLRKLYHLDQPLWTQYREFLAGILQGDLGPSIAYQGRPVTQLISERFPRTLQLGGTVLLLNFTLGIWLGVRQAVRKGGALDRWLTLASLTGYAMPSFWLGLMLAWLFGIHWHLLPVAGPQDPFLAADAGFWTRIADLARHLVLPAVTLSLVSIAATIRYQRSAMVEALHADYVRTARTKGLSERRVIWGHAWRNAIFPVLTLFGLWLPLLAAGSVFVESVFAWPGLGSLAATAIGQRDYPLIMGTSLCAAGLVVLGGVLTDVAYAALDPRVRFR